jgi:hypothetical protein
MAEVSRPSGGQATDLGLLWKGGSGCTLLAPLRGSYSSIARIRAPWLVRKSTRPLDAGNVLKSRSFGCRALPRTDPHLSTPLRTPSGVGWPRCPENSEHDHATLVFEDEVDRQAFTAGSERVASHVRVRALAVVAFPAPRSDLQQRHELGIQRQRGGRQRGDLLYDLGVGFDCVHLPAEPRAGHRPRLSRHRLAGGQLLGALEHPAVGALVA